MQLTFAQDLRSLRMSLPRFVAMAGERLWSKKVAHLRKEMESSPYRAKIVGDRHWLEMEISDQLQPALGASEPRICVDTLAAMQFAQTVDAVHQQLTFAGRASLEGRIRDGLKATSRFSPLYAEIDIARRLFDAGHEVEFSDLEGLARYDLRFARGSNEGEVECKSLSADAGRKIHRSDFYRFIESLRLAVVDRVNAGARETIVVTVDDRLPSDDSSQQLLRTSTLSLLVNASANEQSGPFFSILREPSRLALDTEGPDAEELYKTFKSIYGESCHVGGAAVEGANCLIVMRSRKEDDTSAPQLEALKAAASQFSRTRPAFIAIQYDDVRPADLRRVNLQRRAGILSAHLFCQNQAPHLVANYFSAYGGLTKRGSHVGVPAFSFLNPYTMFDVRADAYPVFLGGRHDQEPTLLSLHGTDETEWAFSGNQTRTESDSSR